jgi:hypothetical protein
MLALSRCRSPKRSGRWRQSGALFGGNLGLTFRSAGRERLLSYMRSPSRFTLRHKLFDGLKLIGDLRAYMPEVMTECCMLHERILRQLLSFTTTNMTLGL